MEIERCRALLTVVEEGSLTAAAERLGYTTSGISRMMAALEEETGFPLLVRGRGARRREAQGRGGTVPTAECLELIPVMQEMLRQAERYEQIAGELRGLTRGTIRIGTSYYAYYEWFARLIADFERNCPGIRTEIVEGTSTELLQAMDENRADLCIISRRAGDFEWIPLKKDQLLACLPADHPRAKAKRFPVEAFAEEDFIELYPGKDTDNSRMFAQCGVRPRVRYKTSDNYAAYAMAAAGLGIVCTNAIIADSFRENVTYLPLSPAQHIQIGMAMPKRGRMSPAAARFAQFAKERFQPET